MHLAQVSVPMKEYVTVVLMVVLMVQEMALASDCNLLDPSHHDTRLDNIVDKILLRTVANHNLDDQSRHTVDTADEDQWRSKHSDIRQSSMYTQLASVTERDSAGQLATLLALVTAEGMVVLLDLAMALVKADRMVSTMANR